MMSRNRIFDVRLFFFDMAHGLSILIGSGWRARKYCLDKSAFKNRNRDKGELIVANHVSFSDPFFYASIFANRRMYYLVSELVMRGKIKSFLLRHGGCIKVNRDIADIESMRKCISILREGRMMIMFPEGTLHHENKVDLTEIKSGAVFLASQSGVPIRPAYSLKPKHWYNRRIVVVGEPFNISDYTGRKFPTIAETEMMASALLGKMNECKRVFDEIEGGRL